MDKTFWITGTHSVYSAINNDKRKIKRIFTVKNINEVKIKKKIPIEQVSKKVFNKIFKDKDLSNNWIAAEIYPFEKKDINNLNLSNAIVILDDISDQRNIGAIIRNCVAFNIKEIVLTKKFFNERSSLLYKSACGALEFANIYQVTNLNNTIDKIKKLGFWVYGMDLQAKVNIDLSFNFQKKSAFVFGSEDKGIKPLVKRHCDELIKIPINEEMESLNVSNSVSSLLVLYNNLIK